MKTVILSIFKDLKGIMSKELKEVTHENQNVDIKEVETRMAGTRPRESGVKERKGRACPPGIGCSLDRRNNA